MVAAADSKLMIQRAAFTLYSGAKGFRIEPKFIFRWAFAVAQAAQFFPLTLCGDETAKELLIDDLKLPFAEFRLIEVPNELYFMPMMAKVYGYKATLDAPTLHIDHDFFLFRKPADKLLAAACVTQDLKPTFKPLDVILDTLRKDRPDLAIPANTVGCCAGVVGFNDLETEKKFVDVSLALAEDSKQLSYYKSINPIWHVTSAIEETLIATYFKGRTVPFLDGPGEKRIVDDWFRAGVTHLNGDLKNNADRCQDIEIRLAALHPEIYRHASKVWWEKYSLLL